MNSSSFARSAASSFDNPAASYCSDVMAFSRPGKEAGSFSLSAAGNVTSDARITQLNEMNLFIRLGSPTHSFRGGMSKVIRAVFLQIEGFEDADAGGGALPGQDRGVLSRRQGRKDARLLRVREREIVRD